MEGYAVDICLTISMGFECLSMCLHKALTLCTGLQSHMPHEARGAVLPSSAAVKKLSFHFLRIPKTHNYIPREQDLKDQCC